MITQARLKELFDYDLLTGFFTNRESRGRARKHCRAGSPSCHGYRRLVVDYERIYEHHAVWLYVHGTWCEEIDHRDGDGMNNAIGNLRECTRTQNNFNADRATGKSGLKGAYLDSRNQQWFSKIQLGGQVKFLGNFDSAEEAHTAFMQAAELYHGEFAFHNRLQEAS